MDPNLELVPQRRIPIDNLIEDFFLHPKWQESTMTADIALIRLKNNVAFTSSKYFSTCLTKICFIVNNDFMICKT